MAKTKSVPTRMCIACRTMQPKTQLVRVVRTPEGEIVLDETGKKPGRGAYVCNAPACLKKMNDKKLFHKSFSADVSTGVYEKVTENVFGNDSNATEH